MAGLVWDKHNKPLLLRSAQRAWQLLERGRTRAQRAVPFTLRLMRWAPVAAGAQDVVRFDLQQMQTSDISGVRYRKGTREGGEGRGHLVTTWGRCCAYCDARRISRAARHRQPRSPGVSDPASNLAVACHNRALEQSPAKDAERVPSILAPITGQSAHRPIPGVSRRVRMPVERADGYWYRWHPFAQKGGSGAPPRPHRRGLRAAID